MFKHIPSLIHGRRQSKPASRKAEYSGKPVDLSVSISITYTYASANLRMQAALAEMALTGPPSDVEDDMEYEAQILGVSLI
jgi:hypothetical protein